MTEIEKTKAFHRNYEKTYGHLTVEQLPPIDWSVKEHLNALLPEYKREQLKAGKEKKTKTISIEGFELWTPTKDKLLFKNTSLTVEPQKRCAVFGENGTGKTMLFHAIASGEVRDWPKSTSVHHMQEMSLDPKAEAVSVIDTVVSAHPLRRVLAPMEEKLTALIKDCEDDKLGAYEENLSYVQSMMRAVSGYDAVERATKTLTVLGFDEKGQASLMSSLSGGLRMRVALAAAFFINPDVLLLDEPTNHLDLPSVLWLENKLRGYSGSFLLVTHDRHLLTNVVTSVFHLQDMQIKPYACGFAEFEKKRAKNDAEREKMIEKFLMRNRNCDPMSSTYKQKLGYQAWQTKRQRRLVAMQGKFTFQAPKVLPGQGTKEAPVDVSLVKVDKVRFSYDVAKGLPFIFDTPISYEITMNTRVGIMGPNGAGKSTLLKLITQKIHPVEGEITTNPDFVLAYFGQHSTKELDMRETAVEFMVRSFPKANLGDLKSHLEKTSVDNSSQQKRMEDLSFSQRSCVIFAKLTFVPPHLLIMDEPTNFLDLDSVDALIGAANKFSKAGGALICVTHNRDFLKRCSDKFLSITPGSFMEYDTMKEAERATYSFIEALERGEAVDAKQAILENRGGGAIHTEEYLAEKEAHRAKLLKNKNAAQAAADAEKAAEDLKKAARAAKTADRIAKQRLDWKKDEMVWAPVKSGKGTVWTLCKVIRNIPAMGVTLEVPSGGRPLLIDAKKCKAENPEGKAGGVPAAGRPKTAPTGGRGGGKARGGGGKARGGGRGGGRGAGTARGGGRGRR